MSNRLYILLNAFLIEVFPLYSIVFAHLYYRGPLLGIILAVIHKCEPPLFNIYLPYNIYISGRFSRCFFRDVLVSFSLLGRV